MQHLIEQALLAEAIARQELAEKELADRFSCCTVEASKQYEYRELVKHYAGQIYAGFCATPDGARGSDMASAVVCAEALAKAVLASLETENINYSEEKDIG